jgi:hypothetical protein
MSKRWTLDVQELPDGDKFIQLNEEILEASGFKEGDNLKWVDNLDGSFTVMNAEMNGYILMSEFNNPETNRRVAVYQFIDNDDRVVDMYEGEELVHSRKISGHTEEYSEDCAENWVMCYGEFAK